MFDQIRTLPVLLRQLLRYLQPMRTCHVKTVLKKVLFKDNHSVAAAVLRTVEGVIGALNEGIDTRSFFSKFGNPETCGYLQFLVGEAGVHYNTAQALSSIVGLLAVEMRQYY